MKDYGLADILPHLRARPMAWARVATFDSTIAAARVAHVINKGKHPIFKTGFAACARRGLDGQHLLYMRFVGEEEEGGSDGETARQ